MLRKIIVSLRCQFSRYYAPRIGTHADRRVRPRYLIPFFLAALYAASSLARDVGTDAATSAQAARQGGALFKVERGGHTTYLFGTIHVGMEKLLKEMTGDDTFTGKFVQRALLDGRNPALADAVEKLLKSGKTTFAGIGMLHLVGDASVQALLRQRGYSVRRTY